MAQKAKAKIAPISIRIKAFIVDMFMILMPILYITTYIILDGKKDFQNSQIAIFACNAMFGIILSIFFIKLAQTPGYKSQQIYLISLKSGKKITFFQAIFRYVCFIFAGCSIVGLLLCFFRKDRLNLHDLMTKTAAVLPNSKAK
ncbi:hypothetical protein BFG04_05360 [Campylobacter pinnipediorum subsp. pinnipediorum]|uniref:RDD domain-containing protein n=1 Tax=Campylobacter pinnipediorum subsp. pinnipediorum TaxID=1660067 RepID=A0AAX0L8W1_9BACT|nr:RDD family protein [Campylobacter pinnipediorum]OPA75874.1 hypothetical protein BFG04_05360 [Campylobacter pinnipediorum subsp. pinnipediorum]